MSDKNNISRRNFLRLGSGVLALGIVPCVLATAPLNIGVIGLGRQGMRLLSQLVTLSHVRIVALCDVVQPVLAAGDAVARAAGHTPYLTSNYRDVLLKKNVQGVIIATPDFAHMPIALMALEADKDVYLETGTKQRFDILQRHADRDRRVLYSDNAVNHRADYAVAAGLVREGMLGQIKRIQIVVNVPSREAPSELTEQQVAWKQFLLQLAPRPFDALMLARWQERRECSNGAAIAQLMQHLRIVHRVMGVTQPINITAHGGVYVWQEARDNPDTFYAILDYAEGFVVSFAIHPGRSTGDAFTLYGTRGTLDLLRGQVTTVDAIEEPVSAAIAQHATEQLTLAAQHASQPLDDLAGWLEAIQRRAVPRVLSEQWERDALTGRYAVEAYRTGRQIRFGDTSDYS